MQTPSADSTDSGVICLSDRTAGGNVECCVDDSKIPVEVRNCGDNYFIYQFKGQMKSDACGRVCASVNGSK